MGGSKKKRKDPPSYERGELYDDDPKARRKIADQLDPKYRGKDLLRLIKQAALKEDGST